MHAQNGGMRHLRSYMASVLLVLFCCYYSGISMFSHVHITNGSSVVHSHLGGSSEHDHSESQYAVIDILSNFQSEYASGCFDVPSPFFQLSQSYTAYEEPSYLNEVRAAYSLRGPPVA